MIDRTNMLKHAERLVKFGGVGVVNTAVDFLVFGFFSSVLLFPAWTSQALGYSAGTANSFIMNRRFTYRKTDESHRTQLIRFLCVNFLSLSISTLLMRMLADQLLWNAYFSKILILAITQALNFTLYSIWVFRD